MRRTSDNFPLVVFGSAAALFGALHLVWNILLEDWVKHQLEHYLGIRMSEMIEKFGAVGFPLLAVIGIIWFLFRYMKQHAEAGRVDPALEAQRLHTEALREQTAVLRTPPREPYSLPRSPATSLPTWLEFEQRFKELEPALQYCRIDHQTGDAGEHWRFTGSFARDAKDRFHAVATLASARLVHEFDLSAFEDLAKETDPKRRWYMALQHLGERYEMSPNFAWQVREDGSRGYIYTGFIDKPAAASATLCLSLAARGL